MTQQPSDSSTSSSPAVRLRWTRGLDSQDVYVKHGLRIGRSKANDILLLDDDTVELNHAQIHVINGTPSLRTTRTNVHVRVGERLVQKLELYPGVCFAIGKADFECLAGQSLPARLLEFDFTKCCHCGEQFAETQPQPGVNSAVATCSQCDQSCLMIQTASLPRCAYLPTNYGLFTAVRFVAHGGMSIVLKGQRDAGLQSVAIKLLWPPSQPGSLATQRFHREAESFECFAVPVSCERFAVWWVRNRITIRRTIIFALTHAG